MISIVSETKAAPRIIKYNITDCRRIKSMDDFYQTVGLLDAIRQEEITDIRQIHMQRANCEKLKDFMVANLKKDRRFKHYTDRFIGNTAAMDWLNYSPVASETIPPDELWVFDLADI